MQFIYPFSYIHSIKKTTQQGCPDASSLEIKTTSNVTLLLFLSVFALPILFFSFSYPSDFHWHPFPFIFILSHSRPLFLSAQDSRVTTNIIWWINKKKNGKQGPYNGRQMESSQSGRSSGSRESWKDFECIVRTCFPCLPKEQKWLG